jgi:hypothetical protein
MWPKQPCCDHTYTWDFRTRGWRVSSSCASAGMRSSIRWPRMTTYPATWTKLHVYHSAVPQARNGGLPDRGEPRQQSADVWTSCLFAGVCSYGDQMNEGGAGSKAASSATGSSIDHRHRRPGEAQFLGCYFDASGTATGCKISSLSAAGICTATNVLSTGTQIFLWTTPAEVRWNYETGRTASPPGGAIQSSRSA